MCTKCGGLLARFKDNFGIWEWCLICGQAKYLEETITRPRKDRAEHYKTRNFPVTQDN